MADNRLPFPQGFLWGAATAAHQVEGDNWNNDWWAFEQQPGAIYQEQRSERACDWWANAERDFDLMAEMAHNTHRLSVEWSRIEPEEGRFDPEAMGRYREMLLALRSRDIEPMVTLFHFSSPLWLSTVGGWQNPGVVARFRRFAQHTVEHLGDLVKLWCTINEPNVYASYGYVLGEYAPGHRSLPLYFRVLRHLLQAHAAAYRVIHAMDGEAKVGLVKHIAIFEELEEGDRASRQVARLLDSLFNEVTLKAIQDGRLGPPLRWIPAIHGPLVDSTDFIGLNYYFRLRVNLMSRNGTRLPVLGPTPGAEVSDAGRKDPFGEIYPLGLYRALKRVAEVGKPIYVTENGLPDRDDARRPSFLLGHLAQVQRAIAEGVDVRGYYHWSFTDNFEWAEGWALRFGLVALDPVTQARTVRRSAELDSQIIRENAVTREMVREYAPKLEGQIFAYISQHSQRLESNHVGRGG